MTSARSTLSVSTDESIEVFFERGWTDGLPVVPPTPELVDAMLAAGGVEGDEVIGSVPERSRTVTAEKAAVNAVMAGCKPEYFPIVLAGLGAVLDPAFNANTVFTSTGGAAVCVIVSGPLAAEVGMNSRHNALGAGNRANATIGRTMRLVGMNVLGARHGDGGLDASSMGHPGKYTFCFAEEDPPEPWQPLRVELGYLLEDTTVTVLPTEGPRQVANHLNEDPEGVLRSFSTMAKTPATFVVGKGGSQGVCVMGPEHAGALQQAGWTKEQAREFLFRETRVTPDELIAGGIVIEKGYQHDMTPGADGKLATFRDPEDIFIVTAGGAGAGWSAYIPNWAPSQHARATTRRVRLPGEALPDCGPDACEVNLTAPVRVSERSH
jgi:hypothetical protein